MTMAIVWTGMVVVSIVCAIITGRVDALAAAVATGATDGVKLCITMAGTLCLWTGVMEIMKQTGLAKKLAGVLKPVLKRLYPTYKKDEPVLSDIAANVSANLLGLGNAATPLGVSAMRKMSARTNKYANNDMIMLIVCNTASIQLIPTTVASVRTAAGSVQPFDILPAVWLASIISVTVGIISAKIFGRIWDWRGK